MSTGAGALVGACLGLAAIAAAFTLARGACDLARRAGGAAERALAARIALDRIAADVARAGLGVCPGDEAACPDEPLELLDAGAIALRGDADRDDRAAAHDPEDALASAAFPCVATGNDEVVAYLRRSRERGRVLFDADLNGSDHASLSDGTPIARRDGVVESIDAGPADAPGDGVAGTLYRVTFVHDARRYGTGRFRVVEPLLDDVVDFAAQGYDAAGAAVGPCGGRDDAAGRTCRGAVRRVRLVLTLAMPGAAPRVLVRDVARGGGA